MNYKMRRRSALRRATRATGLADPAGPGPGEFPVGQSSVCFVTSNFPMVVTDPGSWV